MDKLKGFVFGCLSSASYGLIPLFALPVMAKGVPQDALLFYRFLFAAGMMAILMLLKGESFRIKKDEASALLLLGCVFSLSAIFLFSGYAYMSAGVVATVLFIYPVFVTLIMAFFFKEKLAWTTAVSILLAVGGVAVLYLTGGELAVSLKGMVVVLLSALAYATYIVTVNQSRARNLSGDAVTFYSLTVSMLFFGVRLLWKGGIPPLPDTASFFNTLLLAFFPTVVSVVTMVYAIKYVGSTVTAILGAMEPVTAVLVGMVFFGEKLTFSLSVGIVMIIAAVSIIVLSDRIKQNR